MDARSHLKNLRAELKERGWHAEINAGTLGPVLRVTNPEVPTLNDEIACRDDVFRHAWGQGIGPVTEVVGVADRIMHVLRKVGS